MATASELESAAKGTSPAVIIVHGTISGTIDVGSNKTIVGVCGAEIHGHIQMSGSENVILRNIAVVGLNCTDSPSDCSAGLDAISVESGSHHVWFDHDDISDGSDGNLDMTHAADLITISWTKFHYSGTRSGGHQFCNLIGHSDSNGSEDSGHLRVTFHHDWWADHVDERMPRVRFGEVHVFDSLYTSTGNSFGIEVGVNANIRDEDNVFIGLKNPIDLTHDNSASVIQSIGDIFQNTTGTKSDTGGSAFTPPYSYSLDPASAVQAEVTAGAGPQ